MIIDSHAHFVPPSLLAEIADTAADFPALELVKYDNGFGFSFAGGKPTRPVNPSLSDVAGRLDWMDQHQIDHQVVGGWLDMFGYEMPAEDGEKWSRLINKHLVTSPRRKRDDLSRWQACPCRMGTPPPAFWMMPIKPGSKGL